MDFPPNDAGLDIPTDAEYRIAYRQHLQTLLDGDLDFHDQPGNFATHNFHSFPAKFPPQLPRLFIDELTETGDVILDPMAGSGTTTVEAFLSNRQAIGYDIDPLALDIIRVKTTPLDRHYLELLTEPIAERSRDNIRIHTDDLQAELNGRFDQNTLRFINKWFLPPVQLELFALLQEIEQIQDPLSQTFFKIAFSATIITKSGGVSLALDLGHTRPHLAKRVINRAGEVIFGNDVEAVPPYLTKLLKSPIAEFERRCLQNLAGLLHEDAGHFPVRIEQGDAQDLHLGNNTVDLIVTSPPYASNAIDYMRAHKFSLVWFGHPIDELTIRRRDYIGGENTGNFNFEHLPLNSQAVLETVNTLDPTKAASLHRYYSEMTRVLREMYRVLRPGKTAIIVVGNSIMRGIDAQIPQCLSEIGISLGFDDPLVGVRHLDRDRRMLPTGAIVNNGSIIQQRMHEEHVIALIKPN